MTKYSKELIRRVAAEYPDDDTLHKLMEIGNGSELRILHEKSGGLGGIDPEEIITMIDQSRIQELRQNAETLARRKKLSHDCNAEMRRQMGLES